MIYSYIIPAGGYALNGNIQGHSDSVMGDWAFGYDTLNRLVVGGAAVNAPAPYANTMACWGYDSFGNRTLAAFLSSTTGDCSQQTTPTATYSAANQVTFVSQSAPISYSAPSGFVYDNAGNVTTDGVNSYAYDSEGRLCAVLQPSYMGGGQFRYIYDASGLRVAKGTFTGSFPAKNTVCPAAVPGTNVTLTAQYLLNLGGEQVTELTGSGAWVHSNVWAGSHLDATYDTKGLHFQLADPLGTRRVQTNYQGVVEEYIQSLPFGDELNTVIPSGAPSTADDATEHHFTGKERDPETGEANGNDYFAARYYSSAMGRFLSPDWSAKVEPVPYAKLDDPQTLNLYSYVQNNPLTRVDADGHECELCQKAVNFVATGKAVTDAEFVSTFLRIHKGEILAPCDRKVIFSDLKRVTPKARPRLDWNRSETAEQVRHAIDIRDAWVCNPLQTMVWSCGQWGACLSSMERDPDFSNSERLSFWVLGFFAAEVVLDPVSLELAREFSSGSVVDCVQLWTGTRKPARSPCFWIAGLAGSRGRWISCSPSFTISFIAWHNLYYATSAWTIRCKARPW
jgi:RHS repeat-associated protein